jgi:hypothetical protein
MAANVTPMAAVPQAVAIFAKGRLPIGCQSVTFGSR